MAFLNHGNSWQRCSEDILFCNLQPEIFIVKPTIPTNKTQPAKLRCYFRNVSVSWTKKSSMKGVMQNALHCIVAMLVVQSCYGWDFTSNLDGWTDSKGSKKKHLESPGSYQFGRRHATIIFEDREHAWKNASIWLRKHVSFKMSHNLRGFSWILLGAGSARHHKEPFFFFESEIYLSCEVWKAVVHFFWSSVHLEVLRQTFVEMSCQTKKTPSDQLVLHTR